jgi:hypothetical protein
MRVKPDGTLVNREALEDCEWKDGELVEITTYSLGGALKRGTVLKVSGRYCFWDWNKKKWNVVLDVKIKSGEWLYIVRWNEDEMKQNTRKIDACFAAQMGGSDEHNPDFEAEIDAYINRAEHI